MRILIGLLLVTFAHAQTTWVVDAIPGPGVDFTSIAAGVAAAASGDTLLVMPGSYGPFQVSGKALSIVGDGSATTLVQLPSSYPGTNYVVIQGVPAGTSFRVSGLSIRRDMPGFASQRFAVVGSAAAGSVTLSDVISGPASMASGGGTGLYLSTAVVHAYRCEFTGSPGTLIGLDYGGGGVEMVQQSTFIADACRIQGGSVVSMGPYSSLGGPGVSVSNSTCRITRSELLGGDAQSNTSFGATGGSGLQVSGSSQVTFAGSSANMIRGGDSPIGPTGVGGPGVNCSAPGVVNVFGNVGISGGAGAVGNAAALSGSGITTGLPSLPELALNGTAPTGGDLQANQPVTITIDRGPVGQLFVLCIDLDPGFTLLPGLTNEPFLLSSSAFITSFGLLDAVGHYDTTFVPATGVPQWVDLPLHLQVFAFDAAAGRWLGSNGEQRRFRP